MLGTVLEIAGAPGDPVERSDVTLLCSVSYPSIKDPPDWFYYANGNYHQLTTNKTNGNATSPNYPVIEYEKSDAGIRQYLRMATLTSKWTTENKFTDINIKTERQQAEVIFYKSKLYVFNVTLNSPYTKLKCGYGTKSSTTKEISFTIKGIQFLYITLYIQVMKHFLLQRNQQRPSV
jgi:hypothetical protein